MGVVVIFEDLPHYLVSSAFCAVDPCQQFVLLARLVILVRVHAFSRSHLNASTHVRRSGS